MSSSWRISENGSLHLGQMLLEEIRREVADLLAWYGLVTVRTWKGEIVKNGTAMMHVISLDKRKLSINAAVMDLQASVRVEKKRGDWYTYDPETDAVEVGLDVPDSLQKIINFVKLKLQ